MGPFLIMAFGSSSDVSMVAVSNATQSTSRSVSAIRNVTYELLRGRIGRQDMGTLFRQCHIGSHPEAG